jgi:hypothetical protein
VMWSMHEASIYDLPIPCMIDREWVGDEKINICAFSRTGVLSATFLHSLAGVHQNCSPAMHDLASVKLSESHACFLAASACSSHYPSIHPITSCLPWQLLHMNWWGCVSSH